MRISVQVKPGSKIPSVEKADGLFIVKVKAQPVDGKANQAVIDKLSEYFGVKKADVKILSGFNARKKIVQLPDSVKLPG